MTLAKLDPDTEMLALLRQDRKIQRRQNVKRLACRVAHSILAATRFCAPALATVAAGQFSYAVLGAASSGLDRHQARRLLSALAVVMALQAGRRI